MSDLFWAYWDASVRFALLSAVLLLLIPSLRRWIPAKLVCWAWMLIILRLALPLALPFSGSIFNLSESLQPSTWADALRSGVVDAGWGETLNPAFRTDDELVRSTLVGFSWEQALVTVWLIGIVVLVARLIGNAIRLNYFFKRAERQTSGRLYLIFKDVRRRFGIHANVPLLVSDDVNTPGIAGILNPRIVIPRFCAEELSDEEIRCVLLHELTHYRRGDLFVHHLLLLVSFVHWYNPLVWLVFRQFKISMEQACDADVVNTESITTVRQYGLTLLQVMQHTRGQGNNVSPAGALCLLGDRRGSALGERIQRIARPCRAGSITIALGLGLFSASFLYSITGEARVEQEAERLFGLTRFSSNFFFGSGEESDPTRSDLLVPQVSYGSSEEPVAMTRWRRDFDVRQWVGREVSVQARYRSTVPSADQVFHATLRATGNRRLPGAVTSSFFERVNGDRVMKFRIRIPDGAESLSLSLDSLDRKAVWLREFLVTPLEALDEKAPATAALPDWREET